MKNHPSQFLHLVEDAKTRITEVDVLTVKQKLHNNEKFYLVDVREDHEWQNGHLPKALHLSLGTIEKEIEKIAPDKQANIVLYCGSGFRSALAADALQKMGYSQVVSMQSGINGWLAQGLEIIP